MCMCACVCVCVCVCVQVGVLTLVVSVCPVCPIAFILVGAQTAVPDVIMFLAASNRSKVHVTAYRRLVGIVHTEDLKRKRL